MKIAIYSGQIPSSSFIENLICDLTNKFNHKIVLFGSKKQSVSYPKGVEVHFFSSSIIVQLLVIIFNIIKYSIIKPKVRALVFMQVKDKRNLTFSGKLKYLYRYFVVVNNLPDVFHVQWAKASAEWLFLKELGVKLIVSFRGSHINYSPIADENLAEEYRRVLHKYDAFHAVSYAIAEESLKYNVPKEKIVRITGAVNADLLKSNLPEININNKSKIKLLSVGRAHWVKGYIYALSTCDILKQKNIDFKYTILGTDLDEEFIYNIHDLGLTDYVEIISHVPHDKVFEEYRKADLLLLPSLQEGIANVVIEAMALGLPVISTRCGGMAELIEDNVNGWLVDTYNPEMMADCIIKLIDEDIDFVSIQENARKTVADNFLSDKQVEAYNKLYLDTFNN